MTKYASFDTVVSCSVPTTKNEYPNYYLTHVTPIATRQSRGNRPEVGMPPRLILVPVGKMGEISLQQTWEGVTIIGVS